MCLWGFFNLIKPKTFNKKCIETKVKLNVLHYEKQI